MSSPWRGNCKFYNCPVLDSRFDTMNLITYYCITKTGFVSTKERGTPMTIPIYIQSL